jgi:uncharacterized DUF497 family protein
VLRFTWDSQKARGNAEKHGVTFEEASTVFGDRLSLDIEDPEHSAEELRFVIIGQSTSGRLLVAIYAEPETNTIRLISARTATHRERLQYEDKA